MMVKILCDNIKYRYPNSVNSVLNSYYPFLKMAMIIVVFGDDGNVTVYAILWSVKKKSLFWGPDVQKVFF